MHAAGIDVRRLRADTSAAYQTYLALRTFGIDLVLDVGANIGQFGAELRSFGYAGEIVSFEPLSAAYAELAARAKDDPRWHVHPRTALGDSEGTVEIHVAANLYSSSILPMLAAHTSAAKDSAYVSAERVPIVRLDHVARPYLRDGARTFVKIDAQGFEKHVLDGASRLLPDVTGVLSELSLVPLYEGQPLWREMLDRMASEGFTLWALQPEFTDPRDGRTLQVNGIWFRV